MDAYECIRTKLDVREFDRTPVPAGIKAKVLEAARLTGSGVNRQHWRFILVQEPERLRELADDSTSGQWVSGANFAVIVLTDPSLGFHKIDAGRVIQDMQLAAWNFGVVSRPYTGIRIEELKKGFLIPDGFSATVVVGFGYPRRRIRGKKSRLPMDRIAFLETFGSPLTPDLVVKRDAASPRLERRLAV
jgi:nitroreductase